jgi:membrane-associated protease RseP (regulator of RpoE activity)
MFAEPPRTQADLHFSLFGIPIRVHPFFWLMTVLLCIRSLSKAEGLREMLMILAPWAVALFVSILVHELGHAMVMRAFGFRPWITLYALGGLASRDMSQGYGSRGTGPLAQILISFAGPGAGFLLAGAILAALVLAGHRVEAGIGGMFGVYIGPGDLVGSPMFTTLIWYTIFVSLIWGAVNLLPIYPLDGGQIAREVFLVLNPRGGIRMSLALSMVAAGAMAVLGFRTKDLFIVVMFAYLAYLSFAALQAYNDRRSW